MSNTAEVLTPRETKDAPAHDVSTPPPSYSYQGQEPPTYSEATAVCLPSSVAATHNHEPPSAYESFRDMSPDAPSHTTPLIASSSFDDESVRRGFVRKVCTKTI